MQHLKNTEIKELGEVLLKAGAYLMSSGANSRRIRAIIDRISGSFGYNTELLITHRALMISLSDENDNTFFSSLKRTSPHGVNFRIVSGISRMSWRILEEGWDIVQIERELDRLIALPHYPRLLILSTVALAGASFCRLFGGNWIDMTVAFGATFAGLFVRQELVKRHYNPYICIYSASFTASLISGFFMKYGVDLSPTREHAFATSVLFLIPGVPLINSFSDLIDGNLMNGIVRGINGLIIAFAIALGLISAMLIYQI
ncbi:MAG: threonine/serine exporter family protein [Breznakibacter sp.]